MCAEISKTEEAKRPVILMGEDDKFIAKIYTTQLEKSGYSIEHASNGDEVLRLAYEKSPSLILLDLIMPVKNGFETLRELKADPKLKNIKVVILSNLNQEEDKQRVMDLGAEEYVVKAYISLSELTEAVKRNLS